MAPPTTRQGTADVPWIRNLHGPIHSRPQHLDSPPSRATSKGNSVFDWNPTHQQAFDAIKNAISAETTFVYYD